MRTVLCRRLFCSKKSHFFSDLSPDHIGGVSSHVPDDQVSVLVEEISRERILVKSLRDENELLVSNLMTLNQREAELAELEKALTESNGTIQAYKMQNTENELRLNELHLKFRDYKEAVEIEKVKLKQTQALPILLASVATGVLVLIAVQSYVSLEKQQFKYLKFELDNMWMSRIREMDNRLVQAEDERDSLAAQLHQSKPQSSYLTILGKRLL